MTNTEIAIKIREEYGVSAIIIDQNGGSGISVRHDGAFMKTDMIDFVLHAERAIEEAALTWDVACQKWWGDDPGQLLEDLRDARVAKERGCTS